MIVDITIIVLLLFTAFQGHRHGFVRTFLQMSGWLLSVILAFLWHPYVSDYLIANTKLYHGVSESISGNLAIENPAFEESLSNFPPLISDLIQSTATTITQSLSTRISDIIFTLLCFFLVIILLKIFFFMLVRLFSKDSNDGFIGSIDSFFGLIAGTLKGLLLVFIVLALIVPVTAILGNTSALDYVNESFIGSLLFANNFIFYFF